MNGRSRGSQIIDFINFHIDGEGYIMSHKFKIWVGKQVGNIVFSAGIKIVHADDLMVII
jgi:hypothetical protein